MNIWKSKGHNKKAAWQAKKILSKKEEHIELQDIAVQPCRQSVNIEAIHVNSSCCLQEALETFFHKFQDKKDQKRPKGLGLEAVHFSTSR